MVLIGLSGSGKTTVARLTARRLGWRFRDTDQEIRRQTGRSVQQIFSESGETAFRAVERDVVRRACSGRGSVIATGGGAVLDADNFAAMLTDNVVVFLDAPAETLAARLASSIRKEPRPLLQSDLVGRLMQLGHERQARYRRAHHIVETDGRTPEQVADLIVELIRAG